MRILYIGDIVGLKSLNCLCKTLPILLKENNIDFVIANGENIAKGNGILPDNAIALHQSGVDIITGGNHSLTQHQILPFLDDYSFIIRPYNFPSNLPGNGFVITKSIFGNIGIINLCGQVNMPPVNNPFEAIDRVLSDLSDCSYIFLDFHAEATSEKMAMGFYCDGRITGLFGSHTHVQTFDYHFLPKGTAYITDVGMVGGIDSILGVKKEIILKRFISGYSEKFEQDDKKIYMNSVILDTDAHITEYLNCFLSD